MNRHGKTQSAAPGSGGNLFSSQSEQKLLMRGQGKHLFGSYHPPEPHQSAYQKSFRGLCADVVKPTGLNLAQSCSTGNVIPDPHLVSATKMKTENYYADLEKTARKPAT